MKLTGKAQIAFSHYIANHYEAWEAYDGFGRLPDAMKWGVIVDFFDSVEITIEDVVSFEPTMEGFKVQSYMVCLNGKQQGRRFVNRSKSREYAIQKADEFYNKWK